MDSKILIRTNVMEDGMRRPIGDSILDTMILMRGESKVELI